MRSKLQIYLAKGSWLNICIKERQGQKWMFRGYHGQARNLTNTTFWSPLVGLTFKRRVRGQLSAPGYPEQAVDYNPGSGVS